MSTTESRIKHFMRSEISWIACCKGVVEVRPSSGGSDSSSEDDSEEEDDEGGYGGIVPPFLMIEIATNHV